MRVARFERLNQVFSEDCTVCLLVTPTHYHHNEYQRVTANSLVVLLYILIDSLYLAGIY